MGLRGPKPQPTALKRLKGNPGKRRLNDDEPIPPDGEIQAPPWVRGTALEVWRDRAPVAIAMGVLTTADTYAFARYCVIFGRWLDGETWIADKANGATTYTTYEQGDNGQQRIKSIQELPQAAASRKLSEILSRMEGEFGLTPVARMRLRVERLDAVTAARQAAAEPPTNDQDRRRRAFFASGGAVAAAGA